MFENLGHHCPSVRNVHFRLPSMAQRRGVLKALHCHRAKHVLCKGRMGTSQSYRQGYKWIILKKKPLSVLQFLNTQLDVMTNVYLTQIKSNQLIYGRGIHVLNVRPFLIELQFGSVGF